jgi:hypothetical protein|tara:strand:+ start:367 stop:576 length:210 start_codon:yes stop_codon:yes gene_type:complete
MSDEILKRHIESRKQLEKEKLVKKILESNKLNKSGNKRGLTSSVSKSEKRTKRLQKRLILGVRKVENDG